MHRVSKGLVAIILSAAGLAFSLSAPAKAAVGVYFGTEPDYGPAYAPPPSSSYGPDYAPAYGYDSEYGDNAYGDDGYDAAACDYYAPPWGYPPDYCDDQLWYEPVYFGGAWYSGPIYFRAFGGTNWFWLNGAWRRDEWRGPRPVHIDWNNGRNHFWNGGVRHGGGAFARGFDRRNFNRPGITGGTHVTVHTSAGGVGSGGHFPMRNNGGNFGSHTVIGTVHGFARGFSGGVGHGGFSGTHGNPGHPGGHPGRH